MYIWIGINVDDQLASIKPQVKQLEDTVGFEHSVFTLPFHVSLKISFEASEGVAENIISDIVKIYGDTAPFSIAVRGIEYEGNIAWIRMIANKEIMSLATRLNLFLKEKYGIPLHEYDLDFKFHTTLFMSDDRERVKKAYLSVKDSPLPQALKVNRFLIGVSNSGELGTYRVVREISV